MEITRLIFALLPVYLTLNACVEEKTTDAAATNYRNKDIEGEWISQSISDGVHEKRLYFSFQDSQCRYFFPNFVGNYEIKNNDLLIQSINENKQEYEFKIGSLNSTKMFLIVKKIDRSMQDRIFCYSEATLNEIGATFPSELDTIYLKKTSFKNEIDADRILFRTDSNEDGSPCYIEINKTRKVFYYGTRKNETYGGFVGNITENELLKLKLRINSLNLSELKENYPSSRSDSKSYDFLIEEAEERIKIKAHNSDYEPVELRILTQYIQDLITRLDLIKSNEIKPSRFKDLGIPYVELVQ
jgi:hypothetical protein